MLLKIEMGGNGKIIGREYKDVEGNPVNGVNEAFADDLTVLFKMSIEAMRSLLGILSKYGALSGLHINMEKTHIMVTGKEWDGPEVIEGVRVQKECKLLGAVVDYKCANLSSNWQKCIT